MGGTVDPGETAAKSSAKPAKKPARKAARRSTTAARRRKIAPRPVTEADLSRPPRAFRMSDTYQVGDRVVHASFGTGVVQAVNGPTKMEILFDVGSKILVQGRSES